MSSAYILLLVSAAILSLFANIWSLMRRSIVLFSSSFVLYLFSTSNCRFRDILQLAVLLRCERSRSISGGCYGCITVWERLWRRSTVIDQLHLQLMEEMKMHMTWRRNLECSRHGHCTWLIIETVRVSMCCERRTSFSMQGTERRGTFWASSAIVRFR